MNRTKAGATAFVNLKSIVRTCQKHGRNFLSYGLTLIGLDEQPQPPRLPVSPQPPGSVPANTSSSTPRRNPTPHRHSASTLEPIKLRPRSALQLRNAIGQLQKTVAATRGDRPQRSPLRRSRRPRTTPPEDDPHYVEQQMITTPYNPHARDLTSPPRATNSIADQSIVWLQPWRRNHRENTVPLITVKQMHAKTHDLYRDYTNTLMRTTYEIRPHARRKVESHFLRQHPPDITNAPH